MNQPTYRVGVVGLGAIASSYGSPGETTPYCHAGGLEQTSRVELVAACDMSEAARIGFSEKWGATFPDAQIYADLGAMLAAQKLDVVAVCVRGPHHFNVVKQLLEAAPNSGIRSIFLEKPPTCSLAEMDEILARAKECGVCITVSYSRHWAPHVLHLQKLVEGGLIGPVHTVVGYCGQLVLSFASHTTDLICQFAGYAPQSVRARTVNIETSAPAGFEIEPSLRHLEIEFGNGVLGVQVGQDGDGSAFYVDVFGAEGRVRAGMYAPPAAWDLKGEPLDLGELPPNRSVFAEAYEQIAAFLDGGPLPDCSDETFALVNEIGFAAIESGLSGQHIELPNTNRQRRIWANG